VPFEYEFCLVKHFTERYIQQDVVWHHGLINSLYASITINVKAACYVFGQFAAVCEYSRPINSYTRV